MPKTVAFDDIRGADIVEPTGKTAEGADTFTRWSLDPSHAVKQRAQFEADIPAPIKAKLAALRTTLDAIEGKS